MTVGFESGPSLALVRGTCLTPAQGGFLAPTLSESSSAGLYLVQQLLGEVLELGAPTVQQPLCHVAV